MGTKVLVAIDGSKNSERALDFALDLAEKYNASVMVLNVFQPPAISHVPEEPSAYSSSMAVYSRDLQKIHEETLAKAVDRAKAIKPNLVILSELREGEPASEIAAAAKDGGFDVIVLGHKGLGRMKEFLMGSISERVAHLAHCSVVIVK